MQDIFKKNIKTVLVLGADGMLGNAIFKYFKENNINVIGTSRKNTQEYYFFDVNSFSLSSFEDLLKKYKISYIINCIGYIRPKDNSYEEINNSLLVNSIFPQKLSLVCLKLCIKLIHFSTDCIFSGKRVYYEDCDIPDESNIYGVSKFLGEVKELPNITIRTSIIGREVNNNRNLLDWFLATEEKEVGGYKEVFWNGVSTITVAKIVKKIIDNNIVFEKPIVQIASDKISKYDLLCIFKRIFNKDIIIKPDFSIKSNKTLKASDVQIKYFQEFLLPIEDQILELKNFYE